MGTNHDDTITGTNHVDVIVAKGGDDVVKALGANDVVCAGEGRDRVFGDNVGLSQPATGESRDRMLDGGPKGDRGGDGTADTATPACESVTGVP